MKLFKNIAIVLAAIFFWPLGVIFVWVFTKWSLWIKIFLSLPIIAVFFTFPYIYIAQPYRVSGGSMVPVLNNGEYFIAQKYDKSFKRGDVIVYRNPEDTSQDFIGRIIGLPGEKISINGGKVFINDQRFDEPYVNGQETLPLDDKYSKLNLAQDAYYIMGDNRPHSSDSRARGPIKKNLIIGTYWVTYFKPE